MEISRQILDAISRYHDMYRHPNLIRPSVSGIYLLFPKENVEKTQHRWPEPWPQGDKPGVYLVFCSLMELLYIGKAARLGQRLSVHFKYLKDGSKDCRVVSDGWKTQPMFLVTVALEKSFEAGSMEEYLISELQPTDNRR